MSMVKRRQQESLDELAPPDKAAEFFAGRLAPTNVREGLVEANWIIDRARAEFGPIVRSFLMVSGGNDSMVVLDACAWAADEVVHINTGCGIPQTTEFVRRIVPEWSGFELTELHPPLSFRDVVLDGKLFGGFPGPGAHAFIYTRLKERAVEALLRDRRTKHGQRFMLLTGIRNDESRRRMGYASPIDRKGGQVWVNPLMRWTNALMAEYRAEVALPVNEVTKHLHMSGECLCGAFARPGEKEEVGFFYPEWRAYIEEIEAEAVARGLPNCVWGERPAKKGQAVAGPMCASCTLWAED
jgi:3'-phosphoadenosine 5'-phosphosulfate sulfotransferase (PAPS reductase)/FAD synthetase